MDAPTGGVASRPTAAREQLDPIAELGRRRHLNLGCGRKHIPDAVNLDVTPDTSPDVVHDLNRRPWPFGDNRFDKVSGYDVVEHLEDVIGTMEEIHRVSTDGAIVQITVPHFSCANAFRDPTHRHYFSWYTLHYVTGEHEFSFYTRSRFRRRNSRIIFERTLVNRLVEWWANRNPERYESRWAWIFPAWFLYFELEVVKPDAGETTAAPDRAERAAQA